MKQLIAIIIIMWSCVTMQAQEWWQITPWAPDSNYIMGALPSGEATWVHKDSVAVRDSIFFSNDTIFLRDGSGNVVLPKWYSGSSSPSVGAPYKYGDFYVQQPVTGCGSSWALYQYINDEWVAVFSYDCPLPYSDPDPSPTNELATFGAFPGDLWLYPTPPGLKKGDILLNTVENKLKIWDGTSFVTMWETDTTAISQIISDSLATITTEPDSIQRVGNVISLRDGDGSVDISDKQDALVSGTNIKTVNGNSLLGSGNVSVGTVTSITADAPLTGGTITSSGSIGADTTSTKGLGTQYDLSLKQDKLTGANKRIPYFTGTNTLSNSDNLSYDDKKLGIGTVSPQATLDLSSSGGNNIRFYDSTAGTNHKEWKINIDNNGREMNFISRSDIGSDYNFMTFNRAANSHIMANWYAPFISSTVGTGTNVMTINEVGSIYRDQLKTINTTSLFGSGNISTESPLTFSAPLSRSSNTVSIPAASTSVSGHLTSTDWNTFNGKVGGSGVNNEFAFFYGSGSITSSPTYRINSGNFTAATNIDVNSTGAFQGFRRIMSGLNHGVTNKLPTDMAWGITDYSSTSFPNVYLVGVGKSSIPIMSFDLVRLDNPTQTYLDFDCGYKSGSSVTLADNSATLFRVRNNASVRFSLLGNGDIRTYGALYNASGTSGTSGQVLTSQGTGAWIWTDMPTIPQTFALVGSNIQSWGSTGSFGSGRDVGLGVDPTRQFDNNGDTRLRGAIYDSGNSAGTSGQFLTSNGTGAWTWSAPVTGQILQVSKTTTTSLTTLTTIPFVDTDILLPSTGTAPYSFNSGTSEVTFTNAGTYEITFSGIGRTASGNPDIIVEIFNGSTWSTTGLFNIDTKIASTTSAPLHFSRLITVSANNRIRLRSNGSNVTLDFTRLIIKRLV